MRYTRCTVLTGDYCVFYIGQSNQEGSPSTKGEASRAVTTSDDIIGPEMAAIENVVKHLGLDSWQVDNTQQVKTVIINICKNLFAWCI